MDRTQESYLRMFVGLDAFFDSYVTTIAGIPLFVAAHALLKEIIRLITEAAKKQGTASSGKTSEKNTIRNRLIRLVNRVRLALFNAASGVENIRLLELMNVPLYMLKQMRDDELQRFADIVADEAEKNPKYLTDAGLKPELATTLADTIKEFDDSITARNGSVVNRTKSTDDLAAHFSQGKRHVGVTIQNLMDGLQDDYPDFYAAFMKTRTVHQYGIRHDKDEPEPPTDDKDPTDTPADTDNGEPK
jgi:hypothetical protein